MTFSVDAYPDHLFEGNVTQVRLNPTTESNVVTYEVVVGAANPDHKLIPGLTANLTIYVMREQNVMLLPAKAFAFEPEESDADSKLPRPAGTAADLRLGTDQKCVWVVKDNTLVPTAVTVGAGNGIQTQIVSGLNDGAVVATGYTEMQSGKGPQSDSARSPFAPQPPGRNKKK